MVHPSQQRPKHSARTPRWSVTFKRGAKSRTLGSPPDRRRARLSAFLALLLTAYVGATAYLIYRDDLVGAAVSRQVSMQYAYEERIAALRSELDRLTSRHAVQTEGVEQQLARLLEQQSLIQSRQATLDEIVGRARAAGVDVAIGDVAAAPERAGQRRPLRKMQRPSRSATSRAEPAAGSDQRDADEGEAWRARVAA